MVCVLMHQCVLQMRGNNMSKKVLTGTPRPSVYCKICKIKYIDPCFMHYYIPNSWELKDE